MMQRRSVFFFSLMIWAASPLIRLFMVRVKVSQLIWEVLMVLLNHSHLIKHHLAGHMPAGVHPCRWCQFTLPFLGLEAYRALIRPTNQ
jgi:hypothetical protein